MISKFSYHYVTLLSLIEKGLRFFKFPKFIKSIIYKLKRKHVLCVLEEMHRDILIKYEDFPAEKHSQIYDNVIWVCWLQGEKNAPPLVRRCIENLKENNNSKYEIIVIDLHNYQCFASISKVIMKKYNDGIISHTHFSDILRFNLLMRHGGLWIDATYLTLKELPSLVSENDFFTLASNLYDDKFIPMGRWSGNFIKFSKGNFVPSLMYELFNDYWNKNSKLIDYFLIDYYLEIIYRNFKYFKDQVDNNVKLGDNCFLMSELLFEEFNQKINEQITTDSVKIYKLSYKFSPDKLSKKNTFYKKYIDLD